MNKAKKAAIAALACTMVLGAGAAALTGCGGGDTIHDDIVNGGFETGDLTGWKAEGDFAFDADGIVEEEAVEGLTVTVGGKVGKYYFNGLAATNATSTGTLTSEPFKLGGTGKIGFKLGAGSDKTKCYVEFIEHGTNTVLKKISNEAYDAGFIDDDLVRVVVDLSEHIGKDIYIKVTDNGTTQKSHEYFHLDDFVMYKTEAEVTAANTERSSYIKMYGRPVFENDTPDAKTVKNGNFEDGLNNWQVLEGDAFTPKSVQAATEKFNMAGTLREYNSNGNFLNGWVNGEEKGGVIRSTTFTLQETGIISFLLGNANHNEIYVAVCNDEAIGDIAKDTELFKVSAKEAFKDNALSVNMLRRYINASTYTPDGDAPVNLIGKKLYIKFVDAWENNDFGAAALDDVRCSMTEEEVVALEKDDYKWAMALTGRGSEEIRNTQKYYKEYNYLYELPVMRFVKTPQNLAVKAGTTPVDITDAIENVKASYSGAAETDFTYELVKVAYDGQEITTGFNALTLNKAGIATVTYRATYDGETLDGTFGIEVTDEHQIKNGGFETGDLTGWTVTEGEIHVNSAVNDAEYGWSGAPYNIGGKYHFDGTAAVDLETDTYTLKSENFVLGGAGVISFKLGGHTAVLRVYDVTSGVCLAEYENTAFADVEHAHVEKGNRSLTMTSFYADLSQFIGANLYIEIADITLASGGWYIAHFDDIVTYYEGETAIVLADLVGRTDTLIYTCEGGEKTCEVGWVEATNNITPELVMFTQKVNEYNEANAGSCDFTQYISNVEGAVIGVANPTLNKAITKVSDGTTDYTTGFNAFNLEAGKTYTATYTLTYNDGTQDYIANAMFTIKVLSQYEIRNGGFELGTLEGWTYEQGEGDGKITGDSALSTDETHWGEKIPLNKSGKYFFSGWNANTEEANAYKLTSTRFTLGGSGVISFKLGGNAAVLKVFKADGTQIAEYSNTEFADKNFPHIELGGRWATMTSFYADLHEYVGQELYIELHDKGAAAWGVAFFDEVVTYYEGTTSDVLATLATKNDTVALTCHGGAGELAEINHAEGETYDISWVLAENEYTA